MKLPTNAVPCLISGGLLLSLAGCSMPEAAESGVSAESKAAASAAVKTVEATPVAVKTVAVAQQEVRRTSVQPATVHAFYTANIQAKVHGYVKEVKVDIGDVVKAGDVLAIIDVPETTMQQQMLTALVQRQQAEEQRAKAGIDLAKANVKALEALETEARSKMQQVEAALAATEAEFQRTTDLVQRGSLQPRILDEVRERRDSAAAGKSAVTAAIESAVANVTVAKAKLTAAEADLNVAVAETTAKQREVEYVEQMIKYSTLTAPFGGVVTARSVSPGNLVSERSIDTPLFVISQLDKVRLHIPIPENDAAFVAQGDMINVSFPAFSAESEMSVPVTRLTGNLDPSTRTMLVEAEVANPDGKLIPGMFGQATVILSTNLTATVLPARAVRFSETGDAYVYVIADSKVSVVPVTTGSDDGRTIEITAGLEPGQVVLDTHLQRFKDGEIVRALD
ncbi:MAG: efflux RND transporter periplasmic adaptor subunit [Fuerstiella sp.]